MLGPFDERRDLVGSARRVIPVLQRVLHDRRAVRPVGDGAARTEDVGTHTITASVTDIGGKTASKSITIMITAAPATTTTTVAPPPPGGGPGDCGGRRCQPRDPGDGPPDQL